MRCLVAAGIEFATGELLRTMETVAGREIKMLCEHFEGGGPVGLWEVLFFLSSCSAGMDVQDMATVVHLWAGPAHSYEIWFTKVCWKRGAVKITK